MHIWTLAFFFRAQLAPVENGLRQILRSQERAARHGLRQLHLVAQSLTSASSYEISTVQIRRRDRARVYRHDILTKPDGRALHVVEKRSNNTRERLFYSSMHRSGQADVAPKVYSVSKFSLLSIPEFRSHLFIEYLPNIGLPNLSQSTARPFAERLMKIAHVPVGEVRGVKTVRRETDEVFLDAFVEAVATHCQGQVAASSLAEMKSNWRMVSERDPSAVPLVPCHNDLHHLNVGRRCCDGSDFVFFDWEQFALNRLGSDLHHFISSAFVREGWSEFSGAVCRDYSALAERAFGVRRRDVEFAAHSFALYKCMLRTMQRKKRSLLHARASLAIFDRLRAMS